MGYVLPKNFGQDLVAIIGNQPAFGTPITDPAQMDQTLVEMRLPVGFNPIREFYPAPRLNASNDPDPFVLGMKFASGMWDFYGDARQSGKWLNRLLQGTPVTTRLDPGTSPTFTGFPVVPSYNVVFDTSKAPTASKQPGKCLDAERKKTTGIGPLLARGISGMQLQFKFAGSAAGGREVMITGKDQNGTRLAEKLSWTDSDVATAKSTRRYFQEFKFTVKDTSPSGTTAVAGTLVVTGFTNLYHHKLVFSRDIGNGMTVEIQEGNRDTPTTFSNVFSTRGILTLEDIARFRVGLFAHDYETRTGIAGVFGEGTDLSGFTRLTPKMIPKQGFSFEIQSDDYPDMDGVYPVEVVSFALDNSIRPPRTAYAENFTYPKCVRGAKRNIGWQAIVDHTVEADFDKLVGDAYRFQSIISAVSKPTGGQYTGFRFDMPQAQMISFPARVYQDLGEVKQAITGRGTRGSGMEVTSVEVYSLSDSV